MNAWNAYFHGPYLAARAYLFGQVFLCMVALDTWMLMIGHAGRYGVAGFNVAHFALLDRVTPLPTAALYVATLLLTGLLALTLALLGVRRTPMVVLFLLYTYSWSMSMLDSYQHHYFVSLVLLCMVFFPQVTLAELTPAGSGQPKQRVTRADLLYVLPCMGLLLLYASLPMKQHGYVWFSVCAGGLAAATFLHARHTPHADVRRTGFGYPLLAATISILYTFTAIAKMDAQWCAGHTLRRISSAEHVFAPLLQLATQWGMREATFWSLVATSVIPLELLIALGYALSARQDTTDTADKRWLRACAALSFALALELHVGAEALRLDIGWFSDYMIVLACTFLLPGAAIQSLTRLVTLPAQLIVRLTAESSAAPVRTGEMWLACAAVSGVLGTTAYLLDLPGAPAAALMAALGLWSYALYSRTTHAAKERSTTTQVVHSALGLGIAAVLMWTAVAFSDVRWDYYRYLGGDLQRRGETRAALHAYLKGERYAPKGSSRRNKIRQLQRELGLPAAR